MLKNFKELYDKGWSLGQAIKSKFNNKLDDKLPFQPESGLDMDKIIK